MKAILTVLSPRTLVVLAVLGSSLVSHAATKCDEISNDVRRAIAGDPSKTLMIVEDALVINEACACAIVTAAIEASKADEAFKQEIIQTAYAVAPKMAAQVAECTGAASLATPVAASAAEEEAVVSSGKSGKDGKSVLPVEPAAPVEDVDEFAYIPRDIRGIYLISPGGVGIVGARTVKEVCRDKNKGGGDDDDTKNRRRIISPISRSIAQF